MNNEPVCGTGSPLRDECSGVVLGQGRATLNAARRTEKDPFCAALYLYELCQAAETLLDALPDEAISSTGLSTLLTVIVERAEALAGSLDEGGSR